MKKLHCCKNTQSNYSCKTLYAGKCFRIVCKKVTLTNSNRNHQTNSAQPRPNSLVLCEPVVTTTGLTAHLKVASCKVVWEGVTGPDCHSVDNTAVVPMNLAWMQAVLVKLCLMVRMGLKTDREEQYVLVW
ncbi:hypothetical protein E2C01_014183 [Portunus trituberculatus]|uniref:Uncharacterized protein n=1 Tax=Portunus trituberculatus TaxID=210409 RepID=A0A5B7DJJ8_PORTR|nr:hypothetical protein [Portunus trituberculatus]